MGFAANEPRVYQGCSGCCIYDASVKLFPGNYYDAESGLDWNWHRYRDAKRGCYITADPIGLKGGLNTYAYVESNPLTYSDPWGLEIVGSWGIPPQVQNFNVNISPHGFNTDGGQVNLNVTAAGSAQFTFSANCKDTCTDEEWAENLMADISISYTGNIPIPGMCGAIALGAQ
ncbi:hypothetical protein AB835_09640 [Candidatus Endobugula sertula]|uniref:RHS repeat-associated core domain-containing protein n=1 Tax=Candidatus Endobugula sertula TaxID=62101 RepID=A0A1D2QP20_9GAMM|nr:hypothetical protein AB835_09640 [Candidatus Endobugula sertula]